MPVRPLLCQLLLLAGAALLGGGAGCRGPGAVRSLSGTPGEERQRLVFLGDSITEGHTLPLLLQQALAEAGRPVPLCFNAGIGGDNAAGMRARLERDVLRWRPDLVILSTGINDCGARRTLAEYEGDLEAIAAHLARERVPLLLLTSSVLTGTHASGNARLEPYNAVVCAVAARHGLRVADVYARMSEAVAAGVDPTEADGAHLNFAGYRAMARAVLDALDFGDVPVPDEQAVTPLPGLVSPWWLRPAQPGELPLAAPAVAAFAPGADGWTRCELPEAEPLGHWWRDQERRRGVATSLERRVGPAPAYIGVAEVRVPRERVAWLNTGSYLTAAWLNGEEVYRAARPGWAPGRERLPVRLRRGRNTLVIEAGSQFFLSLTPSPDW
jgi:lysophospholipase L1-like esterase